MVLIKLINASRAEKSYTCQHFRVLDSFCFSGLKSVTVQDCGTLRAPEIFQKGGDEAPRPNGMATEDTGAAQTPKMTDF